MDIDPAMIHKYRLHPGEDQWHIIATDLERSLNAVGWDQPPRLLLILEANRAFLDSLAGDGHPELAEAPAASTNLVAQVELPDEVLHNFGVALPMLAHFMHEHLPLGAVPLKNASMGHHVAAVAVVSEGWGVHADKDDPAAWEELEKAAEKRELHQHPNRREERLVFLVTRERRHVNVMRTRGVDGNPDDVRLTDEERDGGDAVQGQLPHALGLIAEIAFDLPSEAALVAAWHAKHLAENPEEFPSE
jgi:hypothetical protein